MSTTVVILAAGKGTRMRSQLPKVLQPLAGRPLLGHVIETAKRIKAKNIITILVMAVISFKVHLLKKIFNGLNKLNNSVQVMRLK